ncbi:E3 ubiquitin-protein ligase TRIM33-like [Amphiura filiformis]|uniref:E3 ubiquitin-protein ligase TRIM33-like n=1 Tax=Amphiura filiformis TaxID=82378 RepID=UPI003B222E28
MANSLAQTIKTNFLNCAICLDLFHDPRALPCQHGFCRECLEQCVASSKDKQTLVCPTCREEVKISKEGVKVLPVHFLVSSLKDTVDMEEKAQIPSPDTVCSNCNASDGNKAKVRCVDCKKYLCDTCYAYHKTFNAMEDHKVITMEDILAGKVNLKKEEENRYCKVHGKLCEYYCENEKRALCRDCVILNECPAQHSRVSLKKAAQTHSDELKHLIRQNAATLKKFHEAVKTTTNVRAELEIYSQIAIDSLERIEQEYINLVKKMVKDSKGKVDQIKQERIKLLGKKQTNLESTMKEIQKATADTTRVLESESEFEIISTHATLSSQLQKLSMSQPEAVHTSLGYLKFKAATPAIPTIGQLLIDATPNLGEEWELLGQFSTGDFNRLHGLDITCNTGTGDNVVVCSVEKGAKVFSREGQEKCTLYKSPGALDVAVTPNHEYVTAPIGKAQIVIYDNAGKQVSTTPIINVNNKPSNSTSVTVDSSGKIIVGQVLNTISIHNADGSLISKFATESIPCRLAVTSNGEIASSFYDLVLKRGTSVKLMDYSGSNVRVIQPPPEVKLWSPVFVCCSRQGEIFVSDGGSGDPIGVYRFTADGDYLGCVTTQVPSPSGIAISRDGMELFVANNGENFVKIFQRP